MLDQVALGVTEFALGGVFVGALILFLWVVVFRGRARVGNATPNVLSPPLKQTTFEAPESKPIQPIQKSRKRPTLPQVAEATYLPLGELERIVEVLAQRKQVVFFGPPGTGKTLLALEIADFFTRNGGDYQVVALHPSYDYSDMVEGIRPRSVGGQLDYPIVSGTLKRMAELSRENPDARFVLILDEINRANLSRVLGELILLLEYRDSPVILPFSGEAF